MPVTLLPLPADQFPAWFRRCQAEYAADLVATGVDPEVAASQAAQSLESAFPSGGPTAANAVFLLVDTAQATVGYLWVGRDTSDDPASWWVWDVVVDAGSRGKGYGRASMLLAEDYARSQGATSLGLSVFGFNTAARGLYESLGYETTSIKMRKQLTTE